jgi:hypothetical protein
MHYDDYGMYIYDIVLYFKSVLIFVTKLGSLQRSREILMNEVVFSSKRGSSGERDMDDLELPIFDFNTITMATNNFIESNKLGEGGFGIVYRVCCFCYCICICHHIYHKSTYNSHVQTLT